MDRDEISSRGSHINARNAIAGVEVNVYLTAGDWSELVDTGSVEVTQRYEDAPADARVVRVTIYQR